MEKESVIADYKGLTFRVYVDGAGLDIEATDETSLNDIKKDAGESVSHELFCKVYDYGYNYGLKVALLNAGAVVA